MNSIIIGVISDTHIPDRVPGLNPDLITALKVEKVELILHAGDVCVKRVIDELETIAPVLAVRGNRDFMIRKYTPMVREIKRMGVKIALMHGHINLITYWFDKFQYILHGYKRERYLSRLPKVVHGAGVYVFGHTHHPENHWQDGILYFNPGSVSIGDFPNFQKSWGLLKIYEDGCVENRILPLD
ncbi:MAG: hypothetical protein FD147_2320 [Chloroflexi bacterium]|nr:MAG: hypothetical protein FD147_2320 [Chloroflexota bacterium]